MTETYDKESRKTWYDPNREKPTREQLQLGCLQRIADATEAMCKDREKLERDYRYMRESRDRYRADCERLERRNAALRGVITRMKRKAQGK
ncbi:hypothetical protein [Gilvimarinus sp. 1_MG-2023]|uniref:hypothetical protein n=1 Tax=Gilvimarinus sp. 1_MG-2023 TaxID=3062638 RepID=UPI0026E30111|nr:hypothetical protein [Gilvimarinus sp. 1_MG-2023]MDO6747199.1 hypothetical protein [Gilvimarinus sp. 1_MG-2023]